MAKIDKNEFEKVVKNAIEKETDLLLDEQNEIPFLEYFPNQFMQLYTEFDSIEAFFDASPWEMESQEDIEAIPEDEIDAYVAEHTDFPKLQVMVDTAGKRLIERRGN